MNIHSRFVKLDQIVFKVIDVWPPVIDAGYVALRYGVSCVDCDCKHQLDQLQRYDLIRKIHRYKLPPDIYTICHFSANRC